MVLLSIFAGYLIEITALLLGVLSVSASLYIYIQKRKADRHLINLLVREEEIKYLHTAIERLSKNYKTSHNKFIYDLKDEGNQDFIRILNNQKLSLSEELERLKFELLKQRLLELSEKLKEVDRKNVSEALKQPSIEGQLNYLNRILNSNDDTKKLLVKNV